jgi:DNA-binding transcriptional MerR regulator
LLLDFPLAGRCTLSKQGFAQQEVEDTLFKIGDFARLTQVSAKTLRYYDDIGLFKPMHVDKFTGYRYYSFEQLPRLNRILALKDLGFSLENVRQMLNDNISVEELDGMLRLRRMELQQQINDSQARLEQVEARLLLIKQEGKMPDHEIVVKSVPAVKIASARELVPDPAFMRERCMALNAAAYKLIEHTKLETSGTSLAIYHSADENGIDVEMAYFVDSGAVGTTHEKATVRELPAVETMVSAVYRGSYDDFKAVTQLHVAIGKWIESNGYTIAGASREIYLQPPQNLGEGLVGVMELQYPVTKA